MKTLSAHNQTKTDNPHADMIMLCEIQFDTGTVYLCDRKFGADNLNQFNSQVWEPLVISWDTIADGGVDPTTHVQSPSSAGVVVDNNVHVGGYDNFGKLIAANSANFAPVIISRLFAGFSDAGDQIVLFQGTLENPENMIDSELTLRFSGHELGLVGAFSHTVATKDNYPYLDPNDVGKMLPVVYGPCTKVPFIKAYVSIRTKLYADVTGGGPGAVTIYLSTLLYGLTVGSEIIIDGETITITSIKHEEWVDRTDDTYWIQETTSPGYVSRFDNTEWQTYTYATDDADGGPSGTSLTPTWSASTWYADFVAASGESEFRLKVNGAWSTGARPTKVKLSINNLSGMSYLICTIWAYEVAGTPDTTPAYYLTSQTINVAGASTQEFDLTIPGFDSKYDIDRIAFIGQSASGTQRLVLTDIQFYETEYADWDGSEWDATATENKVILTPIGTWWKDERHKEVRVTYDGSGTVDLLIEASANYPNHVSDDTYASLDEKTYNYKYAPLSKLTSDGDNANTNNIEKIEFLQDVRPVEVTGVVANDHKKGAEVVLVLAQYVYLIGHPVYSIGRVYWNDRLLPSANYTAYTGQSGDELTGYEGLACLKFNSNPRRDLYDSAGAVIDMSHVGNVSADVIGILDDASGTITGVSESPIQRPDHIVEHILVNKCGLSAAEIGSLSGSSFAANGYFLGVVINQVPNVSELLARIATQCKSYGFFNSGAFDLKYIPDTETADKTIFDYMVDAGQLWVQETMRADIENKMTGKYNRDWSGYSDSDNPTDDTEVSAYSTYSQNLYGIKEKDGVSMAYVIDGDQAQECLNYLLEERAYPRLLVEFAGGWWLSDLEKGDIIQFSYSAGDRLDNLFSNRVSASDKFMIINLINRPDNSIQITAIQTIEPGTDYITTEDDETITTEGGEGLIAES